MAEPTAFEIRCAAESMGSPWPDLSKMEWAETRSIAPRACVRCSHSVQDDICPTCRADQRTYGKTHA